MLQTPGHLRQSRSRQDAGRGGRSMRLAGAVVALSLSIALVAEDASEAKPGAVPAANAGAGVSLVISVRGPGDRDGDAQRMLDIIRHSVAQGDLRTAEAQLDILEDRYPGSPAAVEARALISRPVATEPGTPPAVASRPPVPSAPAPQPGAQRPSPDTAERAPASEPAKPWTTEIRRVRALAQEFQAATGDRIFFSPASAELGSRAKAVIATQADWLKRNPRVPVLLSAHADDIGSREFNTELSMRRGEAVKLRLVADGIEPERIKVVAHGRERRIANCDSATCAAQNRRVITVIGETEPVVPGLAAGPAQR